MKYGAFFKVSFDGIWLMLNGKMLAFSKGCNTKKWRFSTWENIWRKTKTPVAINTEITGERQ
jgi:hypothetical protein